MRELFGYEIEEPSYGLETEDRHYLELAGTSLTEQLLTDFPDQLPDALIYADLGARPLHYLLLPSLEKAAQERGVKLPEAHFFKMYSSRPAYQNTARLEVRSGLPIEDALEVETERFNRLLELHRQIRNPYMKWQSSKDVKFARRKLRSDHGSHRMREMLREKSASRAQEIRNSLATRGMANPTLAAIDDFVSVISTTHKELSRAFGEPLPLYAMLCHPDLVDDNSMDPNIHWGMVSPFPMNEAGVFNSFSYLHDRISIGYMKEDDVNSLYSTPMPPRFHDMKAMQNLRRDMLGIGRKIAAIS